MEAGFHLVLHELVLLIMLLIKYYDVVNIDIVICAVEWLVLLQWPGCEVLCVVVWVCEFTLDRLLLA